MMKTNGSHSKRRAETVGEKALRALQRAGRKVRAENRRLGLPLIIWQDGKVHEARA